MFNIKQRKKLFLFLSIFLFVVAIFFIVYSGKQNTRAAFTQQSVTYGTGGTIAFDAVGNTSSNLTAAPTQLELAPAPSANLLMHMNGANGSTTFVDETGKTVTTNGNTQISTTNPKLGSGAGYFDGAGDYLSIDDSPDWTFGANNWTIETWVKFNSLPPNGNNIRLLNQRVTDGNFWMTGLQNNAGTYVWLLYAADSNQERIAMYRSVPASININTWYHVAFVRNNNDFYIFQDGVQAGSTLTSAYSYVDFAAPLTIGGYGEVPVFFDGYLDELRVINGQAIWTSNFNPYNPTIEYSPGGYQTSGTWISATFDSTIESAVWPSGAIITANTPANTNVTFEVKAANTEAGLSSATFSNIATGRYAQFRLNLSTSNSLATPTVTALTVNYEEPLKLKNLTSGIVGNDVNFNWTNPNNNSFAGTRIVYRTDHYPISQTDGIVLVDDLGIANDPDSYTHSNITYGVTYFYALYPYTGAGFTGSIPAQVTARAVSTLSKIYTTTADFSAGTLTDTATANNQLTLAPSPTPNTDIKLLLHMNDNFNNSAAVNNNSPLNYGSPQINTSTKYLGPGSGYFNGSSYLDYGSSQNNDFDLGSSDFTADWWEYRTSTSAGSAIMNWDGAGYASYLFGYVAGGGDNNVYVNFKDPVVNSWRYDFVKIMGTVKLNQWVHRAITRQVNTFYTFEDGVLINSWTDNFSTTNLAGYPFYVGNYSGSKYSGYLDEIRLMKNFAAWTSDFSNALPDTEYTIYPYANSGTWTSEVFDSTFVGSQWTSAIVNGTILPNTSSSLRIRSSNNLADFTSQNPPAWSSSFPISMGSSINLPQIIGQYAQFEITLNTTNINITPVIDDLTIFYVDPAITQVDYVWNNFSDDITISVPSGEASLTIPLNTTMISNVSSALEFYKSSNILEGTPIQVSSEAVQTILTYDFRPNNITFSQPVTITLAVDPPVSDPNLLRVAYFNENSQTWETDGITITNSQTNSVTFTTIHFTEFMVGGLSNQPPNIPSFTGPAEINNGSIITNSTPTFNFNLSDPDAADQVKYQIQIATDSGFSNLVVDYTSVLGAQGSKSFIVGQAIGGGTYNVGSEGQTLSANDYWWRVRANDNIIDGNWFTANSGNSAFTYVVSSITFSLDTPSPALLISGNAVEYTGLSTISVSTNDSKGYTLSGYQENLLTNAENNTISNYSGSGATPINPTLWTTNNFIGFGYNLSGDDIDLSKWQTNNYYAPFGIGSGNETTMAARNSANLSPSIININYKLIVDSGISPGTYTTNINLTTIVNP